MLCINSSRGPYNVVFHQSYRTVIDDTIAWLKENKPSKVVLFTDSNVDSLYGTNLMMALANHFPTSKVIIPAGESNKSLPIFVQLLMEIDELKLDRKCIFVALGGGVVGDMTGLVSSVILRGVTWVQIPTTLLSMVDSSVGGKTGINMPSGKNRVGSFYPPDLVISSTDVLQTLELMELKSGWGEVIKHLVIGTSHLRSDLDTLLSGEYPEIYQEPTFCFFIEKLCAVKAKIVELDEHENGIRAVLNFGHTIGHAIEKSLGYGHITHGQAVYLGLCIESGWLYSQGRVPYDLYQYICRLELKLDMSIEIVNNISVMTMFNAISFDKKMQCDKLKLIGFVDFGEPYIFNIEREEQLDLASYAVECLSDLTKFFRNHRT